MSSENQTRPGRNRATPSENPTGPGRNRATRLGTERGPDETARRTRRTKRGPDETERTCFETVEGAHETEGGPPKTATTLFRTNPCSGAIADAIPTKSGGDSVSAGTRSASADIRSASARGEWVTNERCTATKEGTRAFEEDRKATKIHRSETAEALEASAKTRIAKNGPSRQTTVPSGENQGPFELKSRLESAKNRASVAKSPLGSRRARGSGEEAHPRPRALSERAL